MLRTKYCVLLLGLGVWWLRTAGAEAAEGAGWIELFDGRTLEGWHVNPRPIGHGSGGRWFVEDGAICGEQEPRGNGGILLTDRMFRDFELSIDLRPDWGVDSGVFVRANDQGQCVQMMVDYHEAGNVGHLYGEGTGGFNNRPFEIFGQYDAQRRLTGLVTRPAPRQPPAARSIDGAGWVQTWKIGQWNTARLRVVGNPPLITTWLNGALVSEWDGRRFDGPGYDREQVARLLGPEGRIAVQIHGGEGAWPAGARCRWKNIRVRALTPEGDPIDERRQ
jgi:hypothetical protein